MIDNQQKINELIDAVLKYNKYKNLEGRNRKLGLPSKLISESNIEIINGQYFKDGQDGTLNGFTALQVAIQNKNLELVKLLIEKGAIVSEGDLDVAGDGLNTTEAVNNPIYKFLLCKYNPNAKLCKENTTPPVKESMQEQKSTKPTEQKSINFMNPFGNFFSSSSNKKDPTIIKGVSIPSEKFTNKSTKLPPFDDGNIIISVSNRTPWTRLQGPIGYLVFFENKIYFINTYTYNEPHYTIELTGDEKFMENLQTRIDPNKDMYGDVNKFEWTLIDEIDTYSDLNSRLRTATNNPEFAALKKFIYDNFATKSKPTEQFWKSTGGKKSRKSKRRVRKTRRLNKKRIKK